jgi:hypothetical protein
MNPKFSERNDSRPRDENELLLLCARLHIDPETNARVSTLLSGKLDWEYLFQLARRHAVVPLVYHQLKSHAEVEVPAEQLAHFKKNYQDNLARNLFLTAELCNVVRSFAAAGVAIVPYKGPALALFAYGSLALRRFVDLDILVPKAQVLAAKQILIERGFACDVEWNDTQGALLLRTQHNLPLSRESGRLIIELHWEVASSLFASGMRVEDLSERLGTMEVNGLIVPALSPEDLLLSLCVHGSKHFWERLAWICDVAEIVKTRRDLDWDVLLKRALDTGNDRMLKLGLWLANNLLQAPLPVEVAEQMEPEIVSLGGRVVFRLFGDAVPLSLWQSIHFNWKLRTTWQARLKYCRLLFQPNDADIQTLRLPAVVVTVDRAPCGTGTSNVTVQGTTLEQPPSQPNGGGFNSSLSSGTVTLATPLANGATIDVRFLLGIQQTGSFKFYVNVEALP